MSLIRRISGSTLTLTRSAFLICLLWSFAAIRAASRIAVVSWGPNRLDVFGTLMSSLPFHRWWDGNSWRSETLPEPRRGGLHAVSWGPNRLDVFDYDAIDPREFVFHRWWAGTHWEFQLIPTFGARIAALVAVAPAPIDWTF